MDGLGVHRGRLRGHDQCVPAGNIHAAQAEGVTLTLSTSDLQALSDIESTMPGESYSQRCIPVHGLVMDTAARIMDATDGILGHFPGVASDAERQVVRILWTKTVAEGIPASVVTEWKEGSVRVRSANREAGASTPADGIERPTRWVCGA